MTANRIGAEQFSLPHLKYMQEVIALTGFVPLVVIYMHLPMKLNFLCAGATRSGASNALFDDSFRAVRPYLSARGECRSLG